MDREEIMLRQMKGQHLLQPVEGLQAAGDLCGFQAQYVSNALHALRLRSGSSDSTGLVKSWPLLPLRPCPGRTRSGSPGARRHYGAAAGSNFREEFTFCPFKGEKTNDII